MAHFLEFSNSWRTQPMKELPRTPPPHTYTTRDLGVGAFLLSRGFVLQAIAPDHSSPRRVFHFPPDADAVAESFFTGAQVDARLFYNALRNLKTLLSR
jgi:hypothetical protein